MMRLNLCVWFSVVNRSQSTSLPARRDCSCLTLIKTFKTPIFPSRKFSNQHHFSFIRAQPTTHLFRIKIALLSFSRKLLSSCFATIHTIQVRLDPVLSQHHPPSSPVTSRKQQLGQSLGWHNPVQQQQMSYQNQFSIFTHSYSRIRLRH